MNKVYYRKLIRDKIPAKMDRVGAKYEIKKIGKIEFERELIKKVEEEASGLQGARNKNELIEELADVLDVIEEVRKRKKIKPFSIKKARQENMRKKGGFKKRIFLVWSEDTGYRTNEMKR